jgi:hypothetical protein
LWCLSSKIFHKDLNIPTNREEITEFSMRYSDKVTTHANELASTLFEAEP